MSLPLFLPYLDPDIRTLCLMTTQSAWLSCGAPKNRWSALYDVTLNINSHHWEHPSVKEQLRLQEYKHHNRLAMAATSIGRKADNYCCVLLRSVSRIAILKICCLSDSFGGQWRGGWDKVLPCSLSLTPAPSEYAFIPSEIESANTKAFSQELVTVGYTKHMCMDLQKQQRYVETELYFQKYKTINSTVRSHKKYNNLNHNVIIPNHHTHSISCPQITMEHSTMHFF